MKSEMLQAYSTHFISQSILPGSTTAKTNKRVPSSSGSAALQENFASSPWKEEKGGKHWGEICQGVKGPMEDQVNRGRRRPAQRMWRGGVGVCDL